MTFEPVDLDPPSQDECTHPYDDRIKTVNGFSCGNCGGVVETVNPFKDWDEVDVETLGRIQAGIARALFEEGKEGNGNGKS